MWSLQACKSILKVSFIPKVKEMTSWPFVCPADHWKSDPFFVLARTSLISHHPLSAHSGPSFCLHRPREHREREHGDRGRESFHHHKCYRSEDRRGGSWHVRALLRGTEHHVPGAPEPSRRRQQPHWWIAKSGERKCVFLPRVCFTADWPLLLPKENQRFRENWHFKKIKHMIYSTVAGR